MITLKVQTWSFKKCIDLIFTGSWVVVQLWSCLKQMKDEGKFDQLVISLLVNSLGQ